MKQYRLHYSLLWLSLFGLMFGEFGCMKPKPESFPELEIEPDQLQRQIQSGFEMEIIDVRTYEEYAEGHIPNAKFFPAEDIYQNIELIPKDKPVVLYCTMGNQSLLTARMLVEQGYKNVEILKGGLNAWTYEIEKKSYE